MRYSDAPSLALLCKAKTLLGSESHSQLESTQARSQIQNFYAERQWNCLQKSWHIRILLFFLPLPWITVSVKQGCTRLDLPNSLPVIVRLAQSHFLKQDDFGQQLERQNALCEYLAVHRLHRKPSGVWQRFLWVCPVPKPLVLQQLQWGSNAQKDLICSRWCSTEHRLILISRDLYPSQIKRNPFRDRKSLWPYNYSPA